MQDGCHSLFREASWTSNGSLVYFDGPYPARDRVPARAYFGLMLEWVRTWQISKLGNLTPEQNLTVRRTSRGLRRAPIGQNRSQRSAPVGGAAGSHIPSSHS